MPDWTEPADVRFDHGAARRALTQIRLMRVTAAAALERQQSVRDRAMESWRGRTRLLTEEWLAHHHSALTSLGHRLAALETAIEAAIDEATTEQRRREGLQARWRRERREEQLEALEEVGAR